MASYDHIPPISWHFLTPLYDSFCTVVGLGRGFKQKVLGAARYSGTGILVDVGCGTGMLLEMAALKYPDAKLVGIDPDQNALAIARRRLETFGERATLYQAFAEKLSLPDQSADVVVSSLAFHHMPDDAKYRAAGEMYRMLKPGGHAIIADFGEQHNAFFRKLLFFENLEYLKGNFDGIVPMALKDAGFQSIAVVGKHWPGIVLVGAERRAMSSSH